MAEPFVPIMTTGSAGGAGLSPTGSDPPAGVQECGLGPSGGGANTHALQEKSAAGQGVAVGRWSVARLQSFMKRLLVPLVLVPLLAACASAEMPQANPNASDPALTSAEVAKAVALAKQVIADQGAAVSSAYAIALAGTTEDTNTGYPCTSGRELQIKLIGTFPHAVTTGGGPTGSPTSDSAVRAMIITADAASGRACLIRVQTGDGAKEPLTGGTTLPGL